MHPQRVRPVPLARRARGANELDERFDIPDARHVVELYRLIGEQRGGDDRQGGILIASWSDRAAETVTPFDNELDGGHARGVGRGD